MTDENQLNDDNGIMCLFDKEDSITYIVDKNDKTAGVIECNSPKEKIIIPRFVEYESTEYQVITIFTKFIKNKTIKTIEFPSDSKLQTIDSEAFLFSSIECLTIPSEVTNLIKGWCIDTPKLSKVIVSPMNRRFCLFDDQIIIGKTSIEQSDYDCLVFCCRTAKQVTIPNFIKYIDSYSFDQSALESIVIPSEVIEIGAGAFSCRHLQHIEFASNSKLQRIEEYAFLYTSFQSITIPSEVIDIKEGCFYGTPKLTKISVSPLNKRYRSIDDKMIVGKSSIEQKDYDLLLFCVENAKYVTIPNTIKRICSYAFLYSSIKKVIIPSEVTHIGKNAFCGCYNIRRIDFSNNSKLQTIEKSAFLNSTIESVSIPSEVVKIEIGAFCCRMLLIIEINEKSKLRSIDNIFNNSSMNAILMIAPNLKDLLNFSKL